MDKVLLLHSSTDGQTVKILNRIKDELSELYHCDVMDANTVPDIDFNAYSKVMIGASIRYGHLNKKLYQFIEKYAEALKNINAAFFCVNLTARKPGKDTPETSKYVQTFIQKSPWTPEVMDVFAGALYYPRYRWFDRVMIQFIMRMTGGETDPTKEIEYTNWDRVGAFAHRFRTL
ncbi:menaquinone-dependent protoporphyrinogen IX dehydrogenase [Veronia nyctiphanis]|uniref:Protoporphyrinogen IX dehydrogenase [quinone] n=1 Tax=Veronia nyctiphanis TaxID=1278244 RepID=A0A4Q0YMU0_9GAMM|nr:menaquinone-dependent protoporphyrinogen IX dehydrogenase [Veronia nyctiphanis]RXJ72200.1 menaquinone-dependent protoporphyrinogen IX dehydrogenase [Veronia nyctiphanis]